MRLHFEATPEELRSKGKDLIKALRDNLAPFDHELAELLEKALPKKTPDLRPPALRHLQKETERMYGAMLDSMLAEIGDVLEGTIAKSEAGEDLDKALYIGPRGGKWADPKHTIPYDPEKHGAQLGMFGQHAAEVAKKKKQPKPEPKPKPEKYEPPTARYSDEEAKERLGAIGDRMYEDQAMSVTPSGGYEKDDSGLSASDMGLWVQARRKDSLREMRQILSRYKRQISGVPGGKKNPDPEYWEDLDEYHKLGLSDRPQAARMTAEFHPTFGSLQFRVDGRISKEDFGKFRELNQQFNVWWDGRNKCNYVHKKFMREFDVEGYRAGLAEIGIELPEFEGEAGVGPNVAPEVLAEERKKAEEKKAAEIASLDDLPIDQVVDKIRNRRVKNVVAIRRGEDGIFQFFSTFSRDFNEIFSNKSGILSGVTKYNPEAGHARETYDIDLAEEAVEKIKARMPDFTIVQGDLQEARIQRDQELAELKKPIPEVQRKLAPGFKLWPFQNECVRFLDNADGKALIGDEMGLGKTLQTLAWAAKNGKKLLVVCPMTVRRQWLQEADKFFPGHYKALELDSTDKRKGRITAEDLKEATLVTVNYESLSKFTDWIKDAGFDGVVIDESHRAKNPKAKITKTLTELSQDMQHKILLSGTAIMNTRQDLVTQLDIIDPGKYTELRTVYDRMGRGHRKQMLKEDTIGGLAMALQNVRLARTKRVALPDLPDKTTTITTQKVKGCPDLFPGTVQQAYDHEAKIGKAEFAAKYGMSAEDYESIYGEEGGVQATIGEFAGLRAKVAAAKAPATVEVVKEILASSQSRVVVFTESVAASEEIAAAFGDKAVLHNGSVPREKREAAKLEWQRQDDQGNFVSPLRVFVATRQTMAEGANLTAADKVVFNDLPWTAAALDQAESRTHRGGQKNAVNVYWVTAENNLWDEHVSEIIKFKYELHRKANQGKQLTEAEREWMSKQVDVRTVLASIRGEQVGPAPEDASQEDVEASEAVEKSLEGLESSEAVEAFYAVPVALPHREGGWLRKALYIGPRGGRWADAKHTIPYDEEKHGSGKGRGKGKAKEKDSPQLSLFNIVENEPTLTPEQKAQPKSDALLNLDKEIDHGVLQDPENWGLPAGARVNDIWEAPEPDPEEPWSHPDYGKGKGKAPWHESEDWTPDFHSYDYILVNSSAGKDSQAMLTHIVEQADKQGYPRDKIIVIHADLGRVEWEGTKNLAQQQAEHYGLRFEVVQREQNDLVDQIYERLGNLMQRNTDVATLGEAGIRTWQELYDAGADKIHSLLGDGKGDASKDGATRAYDLWIKAEEALYKVGQTNVGRKLRDQRARIEKFTAKAENAKPGSKTETNSWAKVEKAKAELAKWEAKIPEDLAERSAKAIDFGKAIPWPSMQARFCTSDHKRAEVEKFITRLKDEHVAKHGDEKKPRILNSLGIRAQESIGRLKMDNFERQEETGTKVVDRWYPIHTWHEKKVWDLIGKSGVPYHKAYDLGMRRLSCVFCVFASREDLMLAAKHNPELFKAYLELEEKAGFPFKENESLASIRDELMEMKAKGYDLDKLGQWVKKALGLDDVDDALIKSVVSAPTVTRPDLVLLLLEAALIRLRKHGQKIQTAAIEWKATGACVHLETDTESHHVSYLEYPDAYNASIGVMAFARKHGLVLEEHNAPAPLGEEDLDKALTIEEILEAEGWIEFDPDLDLEKAQAHKYIRRVPYTDSKGKRRYRYYYRESSAARAATAGEQIKMAGTVVTVDEVQEDGTVVLRDGDVRWQVRPGEWAKTMASHYGEAYYQHAEKRARQAVNAVLRHVPRALLEDLKGSTDKERMEDLKQRVPEVYAKLQKAFKRAGMDVFQAKTVIGDTLARKGWTPEARGLVLGVVTTPEGAKAAKQHRMVMDAADNLAAGDKVDVKHAATALDLVRADVPAVAKRAENELTKLQEALQKAQEAVGDAGPAGEALAQAMASPALQKLLALAQAFPGLPDKAVQPAKEAMLQVPAVAPRTEPTRLGSETQVYVAGEGGKPVAIKARYKLVEASEIKASHDPTQGFKQTEGYPEGVQERAYHRDKSEQDKVYRNARRLEPRFLVNTNPDAVNGPPMVTDDGVVLGGNSRTMSMQAAYESNPEKAEELKAYMAEHAYETGFKPEDIQAMKRPILVREMVVEDKSQKNMQVLVRQLNESFTQAMDPRTMQVAMARKLDDQAMESMTGAMTEDESLSDFLGSKRANAFMDNLRRVGIIDERNVNQYFSKSGRSERLNEDGKTLIARLLVGRMLDDADLLSNTRPGILKNVAGAVPYMTQATKAGEGYDLGKSVQTALSAINRLQVKVADKVLKPLTKDTKDSEIDSILANEFQDLFGESHPIMDDKRAQALLKVFIQRPGPVQLARVFKEYASLAAANPQNQGGLLGPARKPAEVLQLAIDATNKKDKAAAEVKAAQDKLKAERKQQKDLLVASMNEVLGPEEYIYPSGPGSEETLSKAPFVGPRGGLWADPEHTIPWGGEGGGLPGQTSLLGGHQAQTKDQVMRSRLKALADKNMGAYKKYIKQAESASGASTRYQIFAQAEAAAGYAADALAQMGRKSESKVWARYKTRTRALKRRAHEDMQRSR